MKSGYLICRKGLWAAVVILAALFFLTGCGRHPVPGTQGDIGEQKLRVVTTLFPYYDFVRQIAGDEVELTLVVPAGMDSHSFEPTPADMKMIQEADVLIYNGGAMEQWVADVLGAIDTSQMTAAAMMDYVDVVEEEIVEGMEDEAHGHDQTHETDEAYSHDQTYETGEPHDRGHIHEMDEAVQEGDEDSHRGEYDEHIWTSPVNAMKLTEVIRDVLAEADPDHADAYRAGAELYLTELRQIDAGFREVGAARRRSMIVVGDRFPFRYLAKEYGLDYRAAFSGCSTDTEPSARTIAYLIDKVKDGQIPVVYYLELSSHRVSEIIGEETGAVPLLLHSCHNVTRYELEHGITYVELMKQNIENLRKGLDE